MKLAKVFTVFFSLILAAGVFMGCQGKEGVSEGNSLADELGTGGEMEIQVFIAASLHTVMQKIAERFQEKYPEVKITFNADSSGTLLNQIKEGYTCDIFFSAAQKQMDQLEADGFLRKGTRTDVLKNELVVISRKDSGTKVTGLSDLGKAESIALAEGSVPAGRYTRKALLGLGLLPETENASAVTTREVSAALGGVEISEQDNVSKVRTAVLEGSCEVGTVYYSDTWGYEEELDILEAVGTELTGDIIYPAALVVNREAKEAQITAAKDFLAFLLSEEAKEIFRSYYFIV